MPVIITHANYFILRCYIITAICNNILMKTEDMKMTVISTPVIWLSVILAAIFAEAISERLIAIWFAPASAIALVCGFFDIGVHRQVTIFIVSALLMITVAQTVRSAICRRARNNQDTTDIE